MNNIELEDEYNKGDGKGPLSRLQNENNLGGNRDSMQSRDSGIIPVKSKKLSDNDLSADSVSGRSGKSINHNENVANVMSLRQGSFIKIQF